jgi:hypothetical protein
MKIEGILVVGVLGVSVALAGAMTGCYDEEPVGYAEVTAAPVDIETYPSVVYMGEPVYFYGGRWWHRDGAHWSYYKDEPAELHRQRDVVARMPRRPRPPAPVRETPHHEEGR